jgi:hypothetical protein
VLVHGCSKGRQHPLLPTTAIKGTARPVTSTISDRPRLHDGSCPQRRAPP